MPLILYHPASHPLTRYNENALQPSGEFYSCLAPAAADTDALPTPGTLLFGTGTSVLADTRFGEYQLGSKRLAQPLPSGGAAL